MTSLADVVFYIKSHRGAFTAAALREQLRRNGVPDELVERAFRALDEDPVQARTVLVVEDDPAQTALYQKLLAARGLRVLAAVDPIQASVVLRQHKVDAAILDFSVPGGNGVQVYGWLRRHSVTASIPVLFVSGSAPPDSMAEILRADNNARHLPKPVRPSSLLDALSGLIDARPPPPEP